MSRWRFQRNVRNKDLGALVKTYASEICLRKIPSEILQQLLYIQIFKLEPFNNMNICSIHIRCEWSCSLPCISDCWCSLNSITSHPVSSLSQWLFLPGSLSASPYMSAAALVWWPSHVNSCDPMDDSPPGSTVHGILLARILEWVAISFSRGSSQPRNQTQVSCIAGRFFTHWAVMEVQRIGEMPY